MRDFFRRIFRKIWSQKGKGEEKLFRVATFNLHYAKRPEKIAQAIKKSEELSKADVILFQEIENIEEGKEGDENENGGISDRANYLAAELGFNYIYAPAWRKKTRTHGLATFSRFPIKTHEVVSLEYFSLGFRSRERIALNTVIELPNGEEVLISNVHLDTRINTKDRVKQMESVLRALQKWTQEKIIVGGDLNTIPLYWVKNSFPVFYANPRKHIDKLLYDSGFTTNVPRKRTQRSLVRFRLDGIYSKGLQSAGAGIEKSVKVSDHLPIWEDLKG